MRHVAGWNKADKVRNKTMRPHLNIFLINEMIAEIKIKWKYSVGIMVENRLPKKLMEYRPIGEKRFGYRLPVRSDLKIETGILYPWRQKKKKENEKKKKKNNNKKKKKNRKKKKKNRKKKKMKKKKKKRKKKKKKKKWKKKRRRRITSQFGQGPPIAD